MKFSSSFFAGSFAGAIAGILLFAGFAWGQDSEPIYSAAAHPMETSQIVNHEELPSKPRKSSRDAFSSGRWLLSSYSSAALGKTSRQVYAAHMGLGYHVINDLSLNLEGVGYLVNQDRDTGAIGLDLLPRWHYLRGDQWSLYADGGAGVIYSMERMGHSGTHFNFTLQGGLGVTYDLSDLFVPIGGIRWFHISNARIKGKERNVGFDSPMFYFGFTIPFLKGN